MGSASSVEPSWTTAPIGPSGLYVSSATAGNINIDWVDNSATEQTFRIEHCTDGVSWAEIASVGANVTTYEHSGLPAGPHHYRVRAYSSSSGDSGYSKTISHTL